jgi:serine/threonine protein kinase
LIFTADLTEDVILRAEAEATLLSSVKSPNIVNIIGVSVLPPSVCIVLELCAYGSLSDVIRGDGGPLRKSPLSFSSLDRLYLALGCARSALAIIPISSISRGVAALHSLGRDVVHRDIKSYNFLVDGQLNAKLADLELGMDSKIDEEEDESPFQKDFLANWIPPEVS